MKYIISITMLLGACDLDFTNYPEIEEVKDTEEYHFLCPEYELHVCGKLDNIQLECRDSVGDIHTLKCIIKRSTQMCINVYENGESKVSILHFCSAHD